MRPFSPLWAISYYLVTFASFYHIGQVADEVRLQRKIATDKGVSPRFFSAFTSAAVLYNLPLVLVYYRPPFIQAVWFPFLAIACYYPGIFLADLLYDRLDRGYDYQRKAASKIQKVEWGGLFLLFLCLVAWIIAYLAAPPQ